MVVVAPGPALLDTKNLSCWHAGDSLFGNQPVVIFIGASDRLNVTQTSSRIQAHIFTIAGFKSFPRLTVNPTSELYSAVTRLPADLQGDETRRALAFSLHAYYKELHKDVKESVLEKWAGGENGLHPRVFDDGHAAALATKMHRVQNAEAVASHLSATLAERSVSWIDVDVVLPTRSITVVPPAVPEGRASLVPLPDARPTVDYNQWNIVLDLFGDSSFLPTSRLKRAPSKPTAVSKTRELDDTKLEGLRREMRELVATEESYVSKLRELANSTVARDAAASRDRMMQKLIPPSLRDILALNEEFLERIRSSVDEDEAASKRDSTGVLRFSKIMYEFFPKFKDPYQHYLRVSGQFSKLITELLQDPNSSWAKAIRSAGEQRLRSWLIEPVQRLPRYSLFIDNMVNLLPATDAATSRFLRAKDVVTDICALENEGPQDNARALQRLRNIVSGWSDQFEPVGRLITAVDCNELQVPYEPDPYGKMGIPVTILLFPNSLVVLERHGNVSARGVLAEVDRAPTAPSLINTTQNGAPASPPFALRLAVSLRTTYLTESFTSRLLNIEFYRPTVEPPSDFQPASDYATRVYQFLGAYEGKVSRFLEEAALARIEFRYSEGVRDNDRWALKRVQPPPDGIGLVCAVSALDDFAPIAKAKRPLGRVQIALDDCLADLPPRSNSTYIGGMNVVVNVSLQGDKYTIQTFAGSRRLSSDTVPEDRFLVTITRRIAYTLKLLHDAEKTAITTQHYIAHANLVASSLEPLLNDMNEFGVAGGVQTETKRFRTRSPVKGLSNFLGAVNDRPGGPTKYFGGRARADTAKAAAAPPVLAGPHPGVRPLTYHEASRTQGQGTLESHAKPAVKDPVKQLQETFDSYVVAIRSRQGNIVGQTLQRRHQANESEVNELYNVLIQDPGNYEKGAQASIDVLFAAFEKFLRTAWISKLGPILPSFVLDEIEGVLFSNDPGVVPRFNVALNKAGPDNRDAFTTMISVLSDLVNATGNESDRGTLVMTFAEMLVVQGDPRNHLTLFDKLLQDSEMLFGFQSPAPAPEQPDRTRANGTGSIGSTASSMGKKLGMGLFGLGRSNSKTGEDQSTFGGLFRLGSKRKNNEPDATPPSLGRSILSRTRSTDTRPTTPGSPSLTLSRPGSSYSAQGQEGSRPGSAHGLITSLAPIDEARTKFSQPGLQTRKRRSSLSDLPEVKRGGLHSANTNDAAASPAPRNHNASTSLATPPSQQRPMPAPPPRRPLHQKSPSSSAVLTRGRPTILKENTPPVLRDRNLNTTTNTNPQLPDPFTVEPLRIRATKSPTPSGIPTMTRPGSSLRQTPQFQPPSRSTSPTKPRPPTSPPKPSTSTTTQRLELAQNSPAGPSLQASLDAISTELSATPSVSRRPTDDRALADAKNSLAETKKALAAAEKKIRELDGLYREATAENEVLYEDFNEKLSRAYERVGRGGEEGVMELKRLVRELGGENARLKGEVGALRRENMGLRTRLNYGGK